MSITEITNSAGEIIKTASTNDRSFYLVILGFVIAGFAFMYYYNTNQLLGALDRKDEKMAVALSEVSEALSKNTQVVTELRIKLSSL